MSILLCAWHFSRDVGYTSEQNKEPFSHGAYLLEEETANQSPSTNSMFEVEKRTGREETPSMARALGVLGSRLQN